MKKTTVAIALAVIAAAGFAEFKLFFNNSDKPEDLTISVSDTVYQDNISPDKGIVVDGEVELVCEYDYIPASNTSYELVASELLSNLEKIEKISVYDMRVSRDTSTVFEGYTYYKSIDRYFRTTNDVSTYMSMNLTDSLIGERYSGITGTASPVLIDYDGSIYVKKAGTDQSIPEFDRDEDGVITAKLVFTTPDSFTVTSGEYTYEIVSDNSIWKINSVQ